MKKDYVLITPVHNEEDILETVIESVVSQTIPPVKWVIVDDASTDRTSDIVKKYCMNYDFITSIRLEPTQIESYYEHKTEVFLAGYAQVKDLQYSFMGNLDADIILPHDYYEKILEEFEKDSKLGIASGIYLDKIDGRLQKVLLDKNHCPGALQMFRRDCYEIIGGYKPQKYGGDDTCAEIMARMYDRHTRSFSEIQAVHLRPAGMGHKSSLFRARFYQGLTEYGIGSHPLFMMCRCLRRALLERPFITGGILRMSGFIYGYLIRVKRKVPVEVIRYVRKEQIRRLLDLIKM
ncbi:MAG: glycosyltransferase family 2 protein [Sedimentisphaerales bacterium]|nr:glycosyltransferase family 2 protein [Sedimentisphaerales bacterium]